VLERGDVRRLVRFVATRRYATRDRVIILLSFKAGLRACEIAGLAWPMVLRSNGRLGDQLVLSGSITKNGRCRRVPLHPELALALRHLHTSMGGALTGPVVASERGGHMSAGGIVNWFSATYTALGLSGCSSHSGRRTFITRSARLLARTGGSLRDVQELAGHRHLTTTERYIEGDRVAQRKLVRLL
jgi:integrase/recombinase XerD